MQFMLCKSAPRKGGELSDPLAIFEVQASPTANFCYVNVSWPKAIDQPPAQWRKRTGENETSFFNSFSGSLNTTDNREYITASIGQCDP